MNPLQISILVLIISVATIKSKPVYDRPENTLQLAINRIYSYEMNPDFINSPQRPEKMLLYNRRSPRNLRSAKYATNPCGVFHIGNYLCRNYAHSAADAHFIKVGNHPGK